MARQMWSVKEMHALIAAVRGNPSLYDRRDSDYGRAKDVTNNHFYFYKIISLNRTVFKFR